MGSMCKDLKKLEDLFEETRELFVAFGDRYRQDIVVALGKNKRLTVQELAQTIGLSRPATSHHIKILKDAGMLGEHKEGVRHYYYPTLKQPLERLTTLVDTSRKLDQLQ